MALGNTAAAAKTPAPSFERVSLNPTNFSQGGLVDDVDVDILNAQWCYFNYGNKDSGIEVPALGMLLQETVPGADGKLAQHEQYWSAGDKDFFKPSTAAEHGATDGAFLIPIGQRKQMNQNTNAALLLASLQAAGFPLDRLESMPGGITEGLVGTRVHVNRMAQPKRPGLVKRPRAGMGTAAGPEREDTVMLVTKVVALPGGKGVVQPAQQMSTTQVQAPAGIPAAQPTNGVGQAAAAAQGDPTLDALCGETLMGLLVTNDGKLTKAQLPALAFKALISHPNKKEAVPRIYSDEFLSTCPGIKFDGATVTLG